MRTNRKIDDIQHVLYSLILEIISDTAPWTSWAVTKDYPEAEYFEKTAKPFFYLESPTMVSRIYQQGGRGLGQFEMIVGCWDHRDHGGMEEVRIMSSELIELVDNSYRMHTEQFDVTIGTTTYSNTTLKAQGIRVRNITGPFDRSSGETLKEFRQECTLEINF